MTLLEAVVAFVLLSVVGVVCLDQSRGASQLQSQSAEWTVAVAAAEAALAQAEAGEAPFGPTAAAGPPLARPTPGHGSTALRVERRRWHPGLDVVSVTVPLPGGREYRLERLTPSLAVPR